MKRSKKIIFSLVTLSLPVIILVLLEIVFRLTGVFEQEPLFLVTRKQGIATYQVNPEVANRYFDARAMAVPKLFPDTFYKTKPDNVIRIFCLGGSTTAGFPFEAQVPFPFQLKQMLRLNDPEHEYEVINLGLSAVNSFTVLDFMPEVLNMDPDILVIYMGHNEFYGAFGSASTISLGSNGRLVRLLLYLQKWRIVQALKRLGSVFAGKPQSPSDDKTLMEKVIADQSIPYRSDIYRVTHKNFAENLRAILSKAEDESVPVYLGNLVSNMRNMPPMESLNAHKSETLSGRLDSLGIQRKLQEDTNNASLHFMMGKLLLESGNTNKAAGYFTKARDLDRLRFRASDDLNQIISSVSAEMNVNLVDIKSRIETHSDYGIPGEDLFCDHLHPNPTGYGLMAESYASAIGADWNMESVAEYSKAVHLSPLDWEMGLIKIFRLQHRWPFADKVPDYANYKAYGDSASKEIAYRYVYQNHNWPQSHYDLAAHYLEQNRIAEARRQYRVVSQVYPQRYSPFYRIAQTYMTEDSWQNAETYLNMALARTDNKGMLYLDLARTEWAQGKIGPAIESVQKAIVAPEMNNKQKALATYQLASFLVQGRRFEDAKKVLQDVLRFDPGFDEARDLLEKLPHP